MNTPNPFAPPAANLDGPSLGADAPPSEVPRAVVVILAETRPWLRLMLGVFVTGIALMAFTVLGLGVLGWFGTNVRSSALVLGGLVPLLLIALLYTPPAIYLARCAASIRRLQEGGSWTALEDALRNQKYIWRYLGVLVLAIISLYALGVLLSRLHS
jgi:hypothetical protein